PMNRAPARSASLVSMGGFCTASPPFRSLCQLLRRHRWRPSTSSWNICLCRSSKQHWEARGVTVSALCVGQATWDLCFIVDGYPAENSKAETELLIESGDGPAANAAW